MALETAKTDVLEIAYESGGPADGPTVFLLHGWPDDPRTWRDVAPGIQAAGYRTITPYLRGFGPTRFLDEGTLRDGSIVAHAKDVVDLADALGVDRFSILGHDWGAQAGYMVAALFPERVNSLVALSIHWQAHGLNKIPPYEQAKEFWYQWFMLYDNGAERVRAMPKEFARNGWENWSPKGWFSDDEFDATAKSFENPDWVPITLNSYRCRWRADEPLDPRYAELRERIAATARIGRPTTMIQGAEDGVVLPKTTVGFDDAFTAGYERVVIDGVGHFPSREAPDRVVQEALRRFGGADQAR